MAVESIERSSSGHPGGGVDMPVSRACTIWCCETMGSLNRRQGGGRVSQCLRPEVGGLESSDRNAGELLDFSDQVRRFKGLDDVAITA